jgi:hypothetical protein
VAADSGSKGERDLLRIVYVSDAAPALTAADLAAIAARSAERNRAAGLTGILLHQGERFFAVLEGPSRRLLARMERIIVDPRHARVEILLESAISERRFETWSFGRLPGSAAARGSGADELVRRLAGRLK